MDSESQESALFDEEEEYKTKKELEELKLEPEKELEFIPSFCTETRLRPGRRKYGNMV